MTAVIDTKPGYRVFCEVAAQRGPKLSDLARTSGLPRSRTKEMLKEVIESGDVRCVDTRYYVGNNGITKIAHHSMNYYQTVSSVVTRNSSELRGSEELSASGEGVEALCAPGAEE